MIPVNTPEESARWLERGPQRSPKAYQVLMGGNKGLEVNVKRLDGTVDSFSKPFPAPTKETRDFTEAVDDGLDGIEPYEA